MSKFIFVIALTFPYFSHAQTINLKIDTESVNAAVDYIENNKSFYDVSLKDRVLGGFRHFQGEVSSRTTVGNNQRDIISNEIQKWEKLKDSDLAVLNSATDTQNINHQVEALQRIANLMVFVSRYQEENNNYSGLTMGLWNKMSMQSALLYYYCVDNFRSQGVSCVR